MELSYEWGREPLLVWQPHSFHELRRLWREIGWAQVRERSNSEWRYCLERSEHILSVWDGDRLVAFGRIVDDGIFAIFYDIAVDPDYRRQGIGTKLMKMLMEKLQGRSYAGVYLFRWGTFEGNQRFYEKLGFHATPDGMELLDFMLSE